MSRSRRALLSVWDKSGIIEFASGLAELGWELLASGGTARHLCAAGLQVTDTADYTGLPAICDHRVVTLHPRIHGGILADRDNPGHRVDLESHGIGLIDLVVVNLYPFGKSPGVETIDIGGPTMLRGAAKNHAHVGVVADPGDYSDVLDELRRSGWLSGQTRRRLARKAFAHTRAHDAAILDWFDSSDESSDEPDSGHAVLTEASDTGDQLPETISLDLERVDPLRYGENPHQQAARYRVRGSSSFLDGVKQHGGSQLSYLNVFDAAAAWQLVHDLGPGAAAVVIKHANPCGAARANDLATAYTLAVECDARSAFGGVVATSQVIDNATADAMVQAPQADVIIAAGYDPGVVERLRAKQSRTRLLEVSRESREMPSTESATSLVSRCELRGLGRWRRDFLVQEPHRFDSEPQNWTVVTERVPNTSERADAEFAWRVCAHVSSNAVVVARDGVAWGIGAGQQNRVEAGELAAIKAAGRAAGGACASDAFYPFADGIHAAADAGVAVIVQPGGSVNDASVIAAANERSLAMLFTGERQFRH